MDHYNQKYRRSHKYRRPQYETNDEYNMESDFEMENTYNNTEFNYELENDYEMAPGFELEGEFESNDEMEFDNEYAGDNELNDEYNQMNEAADYGEMENTPGSYRDEMEAELEYVTNEDEFSNWVNEIVVRDHRNRNLRPALSRPIVQRAVRQLSRIASRTLPYLGRRMGGWAGWRKPGYATPGRYNWQRPGYIRRFGYNRPYGPYGYNRPYAGSILPTQPPYSTPDTSQQQAGYSGPDMPPPTQQNDQDGSFKNFVLDTIKNLSQQIAAGNENLAAIKNSMVSSAVNNFPAIVQPKTDAPPEATPPVQGPPAQGEFEFEDYEYNMETDSEYEMETDGEITDGESSFSEETEMALASDLLSVKNDRELDYFLDDLLKKAVGAVSGILNTGPGKMLKGIIKSVAKKALPLAGAAAGTFFGGPAGAALGEKLGTAASGLFELELEGMSNEDREFETARAVVRFGGNAARQVADQASGNPQEDVRHGVMEAASRYAPGLLVRGGRHHHRHYDNGSYGGYESDGGNNGTWYRKGNRIIIENI